MIYLNSGWHNIILTDIRREGKEDAGQAAGGDM